MESLRANIEKEFKEAAERWGVKNDRRKYFSNKYYQIINAIDNMEGITDSYIACAVYEQIDKDMKELEEIQKTYIDLEERWNVKEV